jgi:hypothetical protein
MEKIIKADIALMLSKVALTGKDDTTKILKTVALGLSRSKNAIDTLSIT